MTIATLDYLNTETKRILDKEYRDPSSEAVAKVTSHAAMRYEYGFPVSEESVKEEIKSKWWTKRKAAIEEYYKDAEKLRKLLEERHVKPLAFITEKAWNRLIEEYNLYSFRPSEKGFVRINTAPINNLRESWFTSGFILFALGALCFIASAWYFGNLFWDKPWKEKSWILASAFCAILVSIGVAVLVGISLNFLDQSLFKGRVRAYLKSQTYEETLRALSHNRVFDSNENYYDHGPTVKVIFPSPPAEVVEIVRNLHISPSREGNACFTVTCEAGAVQFEGGLEQAFVKGLEMILFQEEERRRDPILTCQYGKVIAIIAQYGDFPIEKEAIDRVLNSEHLIDVN